MRADIRQSRLTPMPNGLAGARSGRQDGTPANGRSLCKTEVLLAAEGKPRVSLRKHPRVRYQADEPAPPVGSGRMMHFVLLAVAINFAACLFAGKASNLAERNIRAFLTPMMAARERTIDPGEGMAAGQAAQFTPPVEGRRGAGLNAGGSPF